MKTQEMSEKASQRCSKTLTIMIAVLLPAYLAYKQHRPPEMMADDSPFYLAVNTEVPKAGKKWFKASPPGVNSLRSMVKKMLAGSQVHSDKKLVNHNTRKHLVQKLVDN